LNCRTKHCRTSQQLPPWFLSQILQIKGIGLTQIILSIFHSIFIFSNPESLEKSNGLAFSLQIKYFFQNTFSYLKVLCKVSNIPLYKTINKWNMRQILNVPYDYKFNLGGSQGLFSEGLGKSWLFTYNINIFPWNINLFP